MNEPTKGWEERLLDLYEQKKITEIYALIEQELVLQRVEDTVECYIRGYNDAVSVLIGTQKTLDKEGMKAKMKESLNVLNKHE